MPPTHPSGSPQAAAGRRTYPSRCEPCASPASATVTVAPAAAAAAAAATATTAAGTAATSATSIPGGLEAAAASQCGAGAVVNRR